MALDPRPGRATAAHPAADAGADARIARAWATLEAVPDPEIPVVSIRDLGILRAVTIADDAALEVVITPTYSGCPAMAEIAEDIGRALDGAGLGPWRIRTVLAPAWTTDWISAEGRAKLRAYGIAPPARCADGAAPALQARPLHFVPRTRLAGGKDSDTVVCPHCGSADTEPLSQFGSTACKALYRCRSCREPFDYFKPY